MSRARVHPIDQAASLPALCVLLSLLLAGVGFAQAEVTAPESDWLDRFGPGVLDLGQGVAVDAWGQGWITGTTHGAAGRDWVTVKYSPDGERLWARVIDRGDKDRGAAVLPDGEGGAYVAGSVGTLAGDNVLLRRYDGNGTDVWTRVFDKGYSETARSLAAHPHGGFVFGGVVVSLNGGDGFVARFRSDGNETWSKPINLYRHDEVFDVAVASDGSVVAAGRVLRDNAFDLLVRKFSPDGRVLWTHIATMPGRDEGRGVDVDGDGNVYVSGTVSTGEGNETHLDVLLQKFTAEGSPVWSKRVDLDGDDDEGRDLRVDPSGNLLLTGFGKIRETKDAFLLKLDPDGNEIWRQTWDGGGTDGTGSIGLSPDGARILVGGATERSGANYDYLLLHYTQGRPSAAFTVATENPEAGEPVVFEDASAPDKMYLVSWQWDFGDGSTSTDTNPAHAYAYGGEYEVRLTVRDAYQSTHTAVQALHVEGPPPPVATGGGGAGSPDDAEEANPPAGVDTPAIGSFSILAALGLTAILVGVGRRP